MKHSNEIMVYVIDQNIYIQSSRVLYDVKIQLTSTDKNTVYEAAFLKKFNYEKIESTLSPGNYKLLIKSKEVEYEKSIVITLKRIH